MKNLILLAILLSCSLIKAQTTAAIFENAVGIGVTNPDAQLHISGTDNNGVTATVRITSGSQNLLIDGNEIDGLDPSGLHLQNNVSGNLNLLNGGGFLAIRHNSAAGDVHLLQSDGLSYKK